ncbi:MAG: hypothetical protein KJ698_04975 [Actinobacteria bacterium]|nr:hypothetical protein [Actinomycetota bacterium]MBU1492718.1 hypothetical protein [Actinomycetota bacterium]
MGRIVIAALAASLLAAACGDGAVLGSTGTTPPTTSGASSTVPSTTPSSTTEAPVSSATTSTVPPSSTSTTSTTTTTTTTTAGTTTMAPAPVTTDPSLPVGIRGRHLIPWDEVDDDWVLALYSGDLVVGGYVDGPTVLYLVSPDAEVYEITAWSAGSRQPWAIVDWSPDHGRALLRSGPLPPPGNDHRLTQVDLATGARDDVVTVPETTWEIDAAYTEPTGRNFVVGTDDGATEHLEVHRSGGVNAVLVDRPSVPEGIAWLYGQAGTSVVVSDVDGIRLLDNQGGLIRMLNTPGAECWVPRWWSPHQVLAACIPSAEYAAGNWYHQLWLVPDDGSEATELTTVPSGGIVVVDFGIVDARKAAGETVLQWRGDCSSASIEILQPDGSGTTIPIDFPVDVGGVELIGTQRARLAIRYWDDCGQTQSWLGQIAIDGTFLGELVPKVADTAGIISAVGLP